jgi:hypothetical protein
MEITNNADLGTEASMLALRSPVKGSLGTGISMDAADWRRWGGDRFDKMGQKGLRWHSSSKIDALMRR